MLDTIDPVPDSPDPEVGVAPSAAKSKLPTSYSEALRNSPLRALRAGAP